MKVKVKYVDFYDEDLKKSFEIPEYDLGEAMTMDDFVKESPAIFNAAILSALYNAITLDLPSIPVFTIKGVEEGFTILRSDYAEKLEICLKYFESIEEFEFCTTLINLKEKLNHGKRN